MNIKLDKPYKISSKRYKRYEAHYNVPADRSLVTPKKQLGQEVSCDIRWEDESGLQQLLENRIFAIESLVPLNPRLDPGLHELWLHYYGVDNRKEIVDNK